MRYNCKLLWIRAVNTLTFWYLFISGFMTIITSMYLADLKQSNPTMIIFPLLPNYSQYYPVSTTITTANTRTLHNNINKGVICHKEIFVWIVRRKSALNVASGPLILHFSYFRCCLAILDMKHPQHHFYSIEIGLWLIAPQWITNKSQWIRESSVSWNTWDSVCNGIVCLIFYD